MDLAVAASIRGSKKYCLMKNYVSNVAVSAAKRSATNNV
jgi:hypothetical protein